MILDLDDIKEENKKSSKTAGSSEPSFSDEGYLSSNKPGVIRRVFHTRTEFNIYPNGQIYLGKKSAWFEDKIYQVKKKVKKKASEVKKVVKKKIESY